MPAYSGELTPREEAGDQLFAKRDPGRVDRLGHVRRRELRCALAPTNRVGGDDPNEQRFLRRGRARRSTERLRQWQPYSQQLDRTDDNRQAEGSVNASEPGLGARAHGMQLFDRPLRSTERSATLGGLASRCALDGLLRDRLLLGRSLLGRGLAGRSLLRGLLGRRLGGLAGEHRVLEVLQGGDARDALGLDAYLLARRGVPCHTRRTIDALELREARDRNVIPTRDAVRDDL